MRIVLSSLSFAALAGLLLGAGCVPNTEFKGAAHFPGGAPACFTACQSQNMEMSGFVMSGEFASSCVCRPRPIAPAPAPAQPPPPAPQSSQAETDAADVAALTGVVVQKREADAAAARNSQPPPAMHH
jgi:hypothetical protein